MMDEMNIDLEAEIARVRGELVLQQQGKACFAGGAE
jgi:hypothetical protein